MVVVVSGVVQTVMVTMDIMNAYMSRIAGFT
jgi:hypothetical protein